MRFFWVALFATAIFAAGTCLGIVLDRRLFAQAREIPREVSFSSREAPEMSVSRFADALHLTSEQDEQLDAVLTEMNRDLEAYRRASRGASERSREGVVALLTAEQKKKLDELVAAEREKRHKQEIDRTVKFYTTVLELTETQLPAVRTVVVEIKEKKREALAGTADRRKHRTLIKELYGEQGRRLEAILTPAQMKKYKDIGEWLD